MLLSPLNFIAKINLLNLMPDFRQFKNPVLKYEQHNKFPSCRNLTFFKGTSINVCWSPNPAEPGKLGCFFSKQTCLSSVYERRLMFRRSWVRIPALFTGWTFFSHLIVVKIAKFVWKDKYEWKRGLGMAYFFKKTYLFLLMI